VPPPPNFDGQPFPQDLAALEAGTLDVKPGSEDEDVPGVPCEGCAKVGLPCTYDYVRKKPGRKNSYVSILC
jgi:hypothetical protein